MWMAQQVARADTRYGPLDDYWYSPFGMATAAGVQVTVDKALQLAAVLACSRVLSETPAQLPLPLMEQEFDKKRRTRKATDHHLYSLIHDQPNEFQTSYEFRRLLGVHTVLRGNGLAKIGFTGAGKIESLTPMHPDRTRMELLDSGEFRYKYVDRLNKDHTFLREEVFHLRGLTFEGLWGVSLIDLERQSIGAALAVQEYAGRFFSNSVAMSGYIETERMFKDAEQREKFRMSFGQAVKDQNRHGLGLLEGGAKYNQLQISNEQAQFLETRKYLDVDIARIFMVPPHKIGILDRATFSNIEHQSLEFVIYTLMPWLVMWEQAIKRDLILDTDRYYPKHNVSGLLRGDTLSRYKAHAVGIQWGFKTRNEVRRDEDDNPIDGLDDPLQPVNMAAAGGDASGDIMRDRGAMMPGAGYSYAYNPSQDVGARVNRLARQAAERVVSKEVKAVQRALDKFGEEPYDIEAWAKDFYEGHTVFASDVLAVGPEMARMYTEGTCYELLGALDADKAGADNATIKLLERWREEKTDRLAAIAGGE
ncbi:MAG: phage portal protein [Candidatus Marinimicrobia bacterium]|nr:phage portal protein [Candidatus Neomarinimicrobiota bacterium]